MPVAEGWKVRYGVLDDSEAKQLQQLGEENRPLELAELTLNNRALKAVPSKKVVGPRGRTGEAVLLVRTEASLSERRA